MTIQLKAENIIRNGKIPAGTLEEINRVNVLTERVRKRKQEGLDAKPHLCAERSRLVTRSWQETEGQPLVLRRAKLFQKIMEGITVSIWDGELIVGSQTKYLRGGTAGIDYTPDSVVAALSAETLTIGGEVAEAIISEEERASLLEDVAYWKDKAPGHVLRKLVLGLLPEPITDYNEARVFSDIPFLAPCSGRSLDYSRVMEKGIKGIRQKISEAMEKLDFSQWGDWQKYEFLQAGLICCDAVVRLGERYAELAGELAAREKDENRKKRVGKNC